MDIDKRDETTVIQKLNETMYLANDESDNILGESAFALPPQTPRTNHIKK